MVPDLIVILQILVKFVEMIVVLLLPWFLANVGIMTGALLLKRVRMLLLMLMGCVGVVLLVFVLLITPVLLPKYAVLLT